MKYFIKDQNNNSPRIEGAIRGVLNLGNPKFKNKEMGSFDMRTARNKQKKEIELPPYKNRLKGNKNMNSYIPESKSFDLNNGYLSQRNSKLENRKYQLPKNLTNRSNNSV